MIRVLVAYVGTVVVSWLAWNAGAAFGIGWPVMPFPEAVAGVALLWIVGLGFSLAMDRAD